MFAIRMSILFFYLRVFAYPTFRKLVYAMMGLTTVSAIVFISGTAMRCMPFASNWDKGIPGGRCGDQRLFIYLNGSTSIIIDLLIWGLPIPILLGLGFNRRKKYALYLVFSIGLLYVCFPPRGRVSYCAVVVVVADCGSASLASVFRLRVLWVVGVRNDPTCKLSLLPLLARVLSADVDQKGQTWSSACGPRLKSPHRSPPR